MTSFNRITLIATVANEPDARVTNSGDPMLRFTVATERPAADGMPTSVDYIPVIAWRQVAERKDVVQKGSTVLIDGRISTRSFEDDDGKRKWTTEVEARELRALGSAELVGNVGVLNEPMAPVAKAKTASPKSAATLERAAVDEVSLADFDFGEPKPVAGYAAGPKFDAELDEDVPF